MLDSIDGYGITFDHLVKPTEDEDPETLMMNIFNPSDLEAAKYVKMDLGRYNVGTEPVVLLIGAWALTSGKSPPQCECSSQCVAVCRFLLLVKSTCKLRACWLRVYILVRVYILIKESIF